MRFYLETLLVATEDRNDVLFLFNLAFGVSNGFGWLIYKIMEGEETFRITMYFAFLLVTTTIFPLQFKVADHLRLRNEKIVATQQWQIFLFACNSFFLSEKFRTVRIVENV